MANAIIEFLDQKGDIEGLHKFGFVRLLVELDQDGWPLRELGLDDADKVVHKAPETRHGRKTYSVFSDGPIVDDNGRVSSSTVSSAEFEGFWNS